MRVEVPADVYDVLKLWRQRNGSLSLVTPERVARTLRETEAASQEVCNWIELHPGEITRGIVLGFIAEGTELPPELPRGSDEAEGEM